MLNQLDDSLKVRRADINDIQPIYDFLCELVDEDFDSYKFSRAFMMNIVKPNNVYLVAEYQSKVVGFLSFSSRLVLQLGGEKVGKILDLYVQPEMRKKGVGKLLLDNIKMQCRSLKVVQLELTSDVARIESHKFYLREDFVENQKKFVHKIDQNENENPPLGSEHFDSAH